MLNKDAKERVLKEVENLLNEVKENQPDDFELHIESDRNYITVSCTQTKQKYVIEAWDE